MQSILSNIQNDLEEIYEVSVSEDILDFVITDKQFAELISNQKIGNNVLEQLLIAADENYLDVSLYLDDALVKRLNYGHTRTHLHKNSIHDFWVVLEGVSHFLYLAWNATHGRPVTQLELELQAEVDKFVSVTNVFNKNCDTSKLREIWTLLFSNPKFDSSLENDSLERYQKANEYASQFCLNLMQQHKNKTTEMYNELRRFYRLKQKQKLSYISNSEISVCP